jgi:delta14-sterol reductase
VTNHLVGFFSSWMVYGIVLGLHLLVPARKREGYVTDPTTGAPYAYRINGLPVMLLMVGLWYAAGTRGIVPFEWLYLHRWSGLAGAATLGMGASFALVTGAAPVKESFLADFFLGRRFSPQWLRGRVDAKMFLYLVGATMLALNILSFASYHVSTHGQSSSVTLYTALFFWFLVDYMTFEHVHLYTYDLVAERVGFKLVFGCLAFYPYFYLVGLWAVADRAPADVSGLFLVVSAVVFATGWALTRGANMQKYVFKRDPARPFLGVIEPDVISDAERRVLCNGFWGLSRHINYLGEVLMACGLTLALIPSVTAPASPDHRCR